MLTTLAKLNKVGLIIDLTNLGLVPYVAWCACIGLLMKEDRVLLYGVLVVPLLVKTGDVDEEF